MGKFIKGTLYLGCFVIGGLATAIGVELCSAGILGFFPKIRETVNAKKD